MDKGNGKLRKHWDWSGCRHLPMRKSDFRKSTNVPVSRDLWPWAHPGCRLTWRPSCASLVAIQPFVCEKKRFAQNVYRRTDRQTDDGRTPRDCISSWNELMMRSVGKHCTEWLYGMQQAGGKWHQKKLIIIMPDVGNTTQREKAPIKNLPIDKKYPAAS